MNSAPATADLEKHSMLREAFGSLPKTSGKSPLTEQNI